MNTASFIYLFQKIFYNIWVVVACSHVQGCQTLAVNQSNSTNGGIFRREELNYVQRPLSARLVECSNLVTSLNQSKIEKGMKELVNQSFRESAKVPEGIAQFVDESIN